ncbi:hypothetical protein J2T13_003165 [Paenibacillus sp. DS2015]|uniref:hypothetical protein n=1 Tax=Paenibacillus sp. DS2015 TaxID=3373917 RepID=UPI003D223319
MSELTTAILVHNLELSILEQWVRKKKKEAFLTQVNQEWIGLFIENDLRAANKWAGKVSAELKKKVLFFGNYDEWGWRADFWEDGVLKVHIDIPFEQPKKMKLEPLQTEAWLPFAANRESLILLHSLLKTNPLDPNGDNHFKQAFALENLTFMSFDYIKMLGDNKLQEQGIIRVNGNKAKWRVNEVILEVLKEPLEKHGYTLLPASKGADLEKDVTFHKVIDSYRYMIRIDKVENIISKEIRLFYYPPYYIWDIQVWMQEHGYKLEFSYDNESELRTSLLEMLQHVLTKGIPWLESLRIEKFNLQEVYRNVLNPFMNKHGFYLREEGETADKEQQEFIYQTADQKWRILFQHQKNRPKVHTYMKRYNEIINNTLYYPESKNRSDGGDFYYRTSQELGEQLIGAAGAFLNLLQYESTLEYSTNLRGQFF